MNYNNYKYHRRKEDYAEYLKGDSWKCSDSPNGAHSWIIGNQKVCKHCLIVKQSKLYVTD